jgi:hypothetical protein
VAVGRQIPGVDAQWQAAVDHFEQALDFLGGDPGPGAPLGVDEIVGRRLCPGDGLHRNIVHLDEELGIAPVIHRLPVSDGRPDGGAPEITPGLLLGLPGRGLRGGFARLVPAAERPPAPGRRRPVIGQKQEYPLPGLGVKNGPRGSAGGATARRNPGGQQKNDDGAEKCPSLQHLDPSR